MSGENVACEQIPCITKVNIEGKVTSLKIWTKPMKYLQALSSI